MRYLIAMAAAFVLALLAAAFVSTPLANWVVNRFTFESPDEVAELHTAVYMLGNVAALVIGWAIGWFAAPRLVKPPAPPA
jgi:hypothetical protein